jgi:hypothetical protein
MMGGDIGGLLENGKRGADARNFGEINHPSYPVAPHLMRGLAFS